MGLIKDALEAIIRIDRNITEIRKVLMRDRDAKLFRATYMQKPIEPKGSTFDRVTTEKDFCYPDSLTFGGRLRAVRIYEGLKQEELADEIGVTPPHISNLEADKSTPSAMFIRSVSRRFNIDEGWIATGQLPQTTEEAIKAQCCVTPLSGYGYGDGGFPLSFHESEQLRTGYTNQKASGIDYGDPAGDRPAVLTKDDLKKAAVGQPLLTMKQMEEQMEGLMGFYSQTPQSKDTAASGQQNQTQGQ